MEIIKDLTNQNQLKTTLIESIKSTDPLKMKFCYLLEQHGPYLFRFQQPSYNVLPLSVVAGLEDTEAGARVACL